MRVAPALLAFLLGASLPVVAAAQDGAPRPAPRDDRAFSFYDRGPFRPAVPRPETLLGYAVGERNTQFALQERVLLAIADAAKDRVRVEEIGATAEGRRMRLYLVSSPENIQRLDAIRADLQRVADPRGATPAELDAVVARTPAVVMINESVHGNESPGFETAMQTLYHFAASEDPQTVEALRRVVLVLNPSTNPDGHERFTVWYHSIAVGAPYNGAMEHDEPWSVQGRFNHYRFDMNRDVMTTTQLEARALVAAMNRWRPMVAVDQHGQTTNYFFPPTASPANPNLPRDFARWMEIYGRANAAEFDRQGWMYYSRDYFDFFGPFYWDSWPSLTGAIGMTYETDGGGWKGLLWEREDGSLLSFRDGIAKHFTTARATVLATAANHTDRVRSYLAYRREAIEEGRTGTMKRVVWTPGGDPARAAELAATLLRAGIEVRRATVPFASTRAHAYADDAAASRRFEAGAYVVDLAQPQGKLAKALLEPDTELDTAFARIQVEKFRRNQRRGPGQQQEGYEFYDVTAWSLPVLHGVDAFWTEDAPAVTGDLLALPADTAAARVGGELLPHVIASGIVEGRAAQSAYLFSPERTGAPRLAAALLREGFRVSVHQFAMEAGGRQWPRGTYIVRVARNDSTLAGRIDALARESGVDVHGVNSAFTERGQYGIGSEAVVALRTPRVAMIGDEGTSQTAYGALWWLLERRWGIPFTPIGLPTLGSQELSRFNVIILPNASGGALERFLGKDGTEALKAWVRAGGTLITMQGATAWAARESVALTSARALPARDTTAKPASDSAKADTAKGKSEIAAAQRERQDPLAVTSPSAAPDAPVSLPGSHFDVVLDRTHWLTQGFEQPRLTVMSDASTVLKLSKEGSNVAVFPVNGKLRRAGFVFPDNTERLMRGTAYLIEESMGGGHVVLFNGEPTFRAWYRGLDKLVLNAIVLGPGF